MKFTFEIAPPHYICMHSIQDSRGIIYINKILTVVKAFPEKSSPANQKISQL